MTTIWFFRLFNLPYRFICTHTWRYATWPIIDIIYVVKYFQNTTSTCQYPGTNQHDNKRQQQVQLLVHRYRRVLFLRTNFYCRVLHASSFFWSYRFMITCMSTHQVTEWHSRHNYYCLPMRPAIVLHPMLQPNIKTWAPCSNLWLLGISAQLWKAWCMVIWTLTH